MPSKTDIIGEIKRTAFFNGGKPLGAIRFENETGIKPHEWGRYWARFGDALKDAGFEPNTWQNAYSDDILFDKLIELSRKLGKFPTYGEIEVERRSDAGLPTPKAFFKRLGGKERLARLVSEYCSRHQGYDDIVAFCNAIARNGVEEHDANISFGEVYLFKSGRY